jgi:anti-sigma B factor antagonist
VSRFPLSLGEADYPSGQQQMDIKNKLGEGATMNLKTETSGKQMVIFVREERLDAHNSEELKAEMNRLFAGGSKELIVDLKDVRFIDSSGLGVLVSGFKNASSRQGTIKLSGLQTQVKSMFELTRLHRVFDIFQTVDDALESY